MRARTVLPTIAALCAAAVTWGAAVPALAREAPPDGPPSADAASIFRPSEPETYRVRARGSITVDWKRRSGPVDERCQTWSDESGSATHSFVSRTGTVITGSPWAFDGMVDAKTTRSRSWKRRFGSEQAAGCPGICPAGPTARAADGTCEPARPTGAGRDDCGTRRTRRTSVTLGLDRLSDTPDDVLESPISKRLRWRIEMRTLHQTEAFKNCRAYGEEFLTVPLPVSLTNAEVRAIRSLDKGEQRTFDEVLGGVDCTPFGAQNVTCSADYETWVRIRRVR